VQQPSAGLAECLGPSSCSPRRPTLRRSDGVCEKRIASPKFPARAEFVYGEWLRDAFEAGEIPLPVRHPEITLVLAQAKHTAALPRKVRIMPQTTYLQRTSGDGVLSRQITAIRAGNSTRHE